MMLLPPPCCTVRMVFFCCCLFYTKHFENYWILHAISFTHFGVGVLFIVMPLCCFNFLYFLIMTHIVFQATSEVLGILHFLFDSFQQGRCHVCFVSSLQTMTAAVR